MLFALKKNIFTKFVLIGIICFSCKICNSMINAGGAGVIPYYKDGTYISFLLGSEKRENSRYPEFCDFGGRANKNEDSIQTAAREAHEEMCGLLHWADCWKNHKKKYCPIFGKKEGVNSLIKRIKQKTLYSSYKNRRSNFSYKIYFVDITNLVKKCGGRNKVVTELKRMRNDVDTSRKINPKTKRCYLEKKGFRWFTKPELLQKLKSGNRELRKCFRNHLFATMGSKDNRTGCKDLRAAKLI
jgi:hypothetical protein